MRVWIQSVLQERQGGVSTYAAALRRFLPVWGAELVEDEDCDVLLHLGPHDYGDVATATKPSVIVVHDLIPEIILGDEEVRARRAAALASASAVIAVSEWTKQDLLREYTIAPEKIKVVHHGVGLADESVGAEENPNPALKSLPRKFLLYVGKRNGYKRFRWMLRALAPVLWRHPRLRLVCTGEPFCRREWAWIIALGLWGRVSVRRYSAVEMRGLYRSAEVLLYPSVHEGFGLPVVEALSEGCQVVASRSTCLPEVGGEAAAYFDPDDDRDFRRKVREALRVSRDQDRRIAAAVKGRNWASHFSWARCVRETFEILEGVR